MFYLLHLYMYEGQDGGGGGGGGGGGVEGRRGSENG